MVTINLPRPWSYRTPEKTIDFPAGEHEVFQYVADRAEKDGALGERTAHSPDPLDASIPELTAYLATITDTGELMAMRRAEEAGKTRKGALEAIEARIAGL